MHNNIFLQIPSQNYVWDLQNITAIKHLSALFPFKGWYFCVSGPYSGSPEQKLWKLHRGDWFIHSDIAVAESSLCNHESYRINLLLNVLSAYGKILGISHLQVVTMEHRFSFCFVQFIIGLHLRVLDRFVVYLWMLRFGYQESI